MRKRWKPAACALLAALAAAGCSGPPRPADPSQAREALRAALDAWKRGEAPEALAQGRPPVYVHDDDWQAGRRLLDYELSGDEPFGGELRCRATLSLDGGGGPATKAAVYGVGVGPTLTITREEGQ
jgi:hypothetical protein